MSTVKLGQMHYQEKDGKGIFGKYTKKGVVMTEKQKDINERVVKTLTQNISAQILSNEFKEKFDTRDVATNLYHVKPTTFAKISSKMGRLLSSVQNDDQVTLRRLETAQNNYFSYKAKSSLLNYIKDRQYEDDELHAGEYGRPMSEKTQGVVENLLADKEFMKLVVANTGKDNVPRDLLDGDQARVKRGVLNALKKYTGVASVINSFQEILDYQMKATPIRSQ